MKKLESLSLNMRFGHFREWGGDGDGDSDGDGSAVDLFLECMGDSRGYTDSIVLRRRYLWRRRSP